MVFIEFSSLRCQLVPDLVLLYSIHPLSLNSTPFSQKTRATKLDDVMQGDEPEPPKKKKDRKGKKNKKKKDRSKKGGKKESRKKRKEAEALEEGFLEVSPHQIEYLTAAVTKPTTAVATPTEQIDSIPEMPTHEPDSLLTTSPEDVTVTLSALPQSTQTEVEVDCKHCPILLTLLTPPTDLNTS